MNDVKGLSEIVEKIVYLGQSHTSTCHFYSRVYSMLCSDNVTRIYTKRSAHHVTFDDIFKVHMVTFLYH